MRNKLVFLAGLGVGYVLGSRAGRERYEQIAQASRRVTEHPKVQETAGLIQAKTGALVNTAKDVVNTKFANTKLGDKVTSLLTGRHSAPENGQAELLTAESIASPTALP
ncbi:MAG: hypothetical protein ACR2JX_05860 [Mycobacteriales bacterium]